MSDLTPEQIRETLATTKVAFFGAFQGIPDDLAEAERGLDIIERAALAYADLLEKAEPMMWCLTEGCPAEYCGSDMYGYNHEKDGHEEVRRLLVRGEQ